MEADLTTGRPPGPAVKPRPESERAWQWPPETEDDLTWLARRAGCAQVTVTVPHSESPRRRDGATLRMLPCQLNSFMLLMAHFVLVACAMCASSHHGDILHPCSPSDVMATPGRCQRVLLGLVLARQLP
jgi:hypothetical protein